MNVTTHAERMRASYYNPYAATAAAQPPVDLNTTATAAAGSAFPSQVQPFAHNGSFYGSAGQPPLPQYDDHHSTIGAPQPEIPQTPFTAASTYETSLARGMSQVGLEESSQLRSTTQFWVETLKQQKQRMLVRQRYEDMLAVCSGGGTSGVHSYVVEKERTWR